MKDFDLDTSELKINIFIGFDLGNGEVSYVFGSWMLLSKTKICTSHRYGFELSADAQRIAITLSLT